MRILYERDTEVKKCDEWAAGDDRGYVLRFVLCLAWDRGLRWGISTNDFTVWDKRLYKCVFMALEMMHDESPRYERLKSHVRRKGYWRFL